MIPELTLDIESIVKHWKGNEDSIQWVKEHCDVFHAENSDIPLYICLDTFVDMGVFKEFKKTYPISEFFVYGYCDTEDSLVKYLQNYVDDKENNYFVMFNFMSMDYEKYYKQGSYINKDGIDTDEDYYEYIRKHPEMEVSQDYENKWITFSIVKLKKED